MTTEDYVPALLQKRHQNLISILTRVFAWSPSENMRDWLVGGGWLAGSSPDILILKTTLRIIWRTAGREISLHTSTDYSWAVEHNHHVQFLLQFGSDWMSPSSQSVSPWWYSNDEDAGASRASLVMGMVMVQTLSDTKNTSAPAPVPAKTSSINPYYTLDTDIARLDTCKK